MRLNTLSPAPGAKKSSKRVGRGIGCGNGKTCGRGHKGQKSRSGGFHKVGFEGGQMPLQRRLPKVGFRSRKARLTDEVCLGELKKIDGDIVSMETLYAADILPRRIQRAKLIASGSVERAFTVKGVGVTKGARAAIEQAGGKIEE